MLQGQSPAAAAVELIQNATLAFNKGQFLEAQTIFGKLKDIQGVEGFKRQDWCRLQYARAASKLGRYDVAEYELNGLRDQYRTKGTMLEAHILRLLAEVRVALGNFTEVDELLHNAAEIYDTQGEIEYLGAVTYLQAILSINDGNLVESVHQIQQYANPLSQIRIPDIGGFSIEPAPIDLRTPTLAGV